MLRYINGRRHALDAVKEHIVTQVVENVVEASILLSGIGLESDGLTVAHAIHDALSYLPKPLPKLQGEKLPSGYWCSWFWRGKIQVK